jgi:hypothetical protein
MCGAARAGRGAAAAWLVLLGAAQAGRAAEPAAAQSETWRVSAELRLRYERGHEAGRESAHAETARARLGLQTPLWHRLQAYVEGEHTEALDRTSYQAASADGLGRNLTSIADPESSELNQLWASWAPLPGASLRVGRQSWNLGEQRFVSRAVWRQNDQTLDAAWLRLQPASALSFEGAYLWRVNRIYGSKRAANPAHGDFDSRSTLLHARWERFTAAQLGSYAYFFELDNGAGAGASNRTLGAQLSGSTELGAERKLGYHAEYALQSDAGRSPLDYRTHYFRGEIWGRAGTLSAALGCEVLAADGGVGFQTPVGSLHRWNGWADVFLTTPASGLVDRYVSLEIPLPGGLRASLAHHEFGSQRGSGDLGRELDAMLSRELPWGLTGALKYARFRSESGALADLRRFSVQLEYRR